MAQTNAQRVASRAVAAWLSHHERNAAWLVRQTEADPGTVGDFLNGNRWPKYKTQGRIEKALGWPAGTLTAVADGAPVPDLDQAEVPVGGDRHDVASQDSLIFRQPDGLTDEQWKRARERSRGAVEWIIQQVADEG